MTQMYQFVFASRRERRRR